jgi:hypothetical protein
MQRHRRFVNGKRYMRVSGYWDSSPHYVVGNARPEPPAVAAPPAGA